MDRFACYVPGWEMPKNSTEYLTSNYGLITDYLAEAFHYQLKHTNRYEEVSNRIKLGSSVEGRDEKGIKKTVSAFLKILHPIEPPSDAEFEEYVAYAIECRRRIKEQMNKRKPDDEFARINLSYFDTEGQEQLVFCPETKNAGATLEPVRRQLNVESAVTTPIPETENPAQVPESQQSAGGESQIDEPVTRELEEKHFTIMYGDTGYTYDSIVGPYLDGVKTVTIEDPYIRVTHQVHNFVRFCEALLKQPTLRNIKLITSYDDQTDVTDLQDRLDALAQSLLESDVALEIKLNENLHDREISFDNGWKIKIGRGLDFYQKTDSWFSVGANDFSLRKCLETKVDIYFEKK